MQIHPRRLAGENLRECTGNYSLPDSGRPRGSPTRVDVSRTQGTLPWHLLCARPLEHGVGWGLEVRSLGFYAAGVLSVAKLGRRDFPLIGSISRRTGVLRAASSLPENGVDEPVFEDVLPSLLLWRGRGEARRVPWPRKSGVNGPLVRVSVASNFHIHVVQ